MAFKAVIYRSSGKRSFLATAIAVLIFLVACLPPLLLILHKLFPFHLSFLSPFIIVLHKPQY